MSMDKKKGGDNMTGADIDERKKDAVEIAELLNSLSGKTKEECRKAIKWLIAGANIKEMAEKSA